MLSDSTWSQEGHPVSCMYSNILLGSLYFERGNFITLCTSFGRKYANFIEIYLEFHPQERLSVCNAQTPWTRGTSVKHLRGAISGWVVLTFLVLLTDKGVNTDSKPDRSRLSVLT